MKRYLKSYVDPAKVFDVVSESMSDQVGHRCVMRVGTHRQGVPSVVGGPLSYQHQKSVTMWKYIEHMRTSRKIIAKQI